MNTPLKHIPDDALQQLPPEQLLEEIRQLRGQLRWHRDLADNDRCWHADRELYGRTLPEDVEPGRMTSPKPELRHNCDTYIDQQQCELRGCTGAQLTPPARNPADVCCHNCHRLTHPASNFGKCVHCGHYLDDQGNVIRIGSP